MRNGSNSDCHLCLLRPPTFAHQISINQVKMEASAILPGSILISPNQLFFKLLGIRLVLFPFNIEVTGNPYFALELVWSVGGASDVTGVPVKGNKNVGWTTLKQNWGQKWETNVKLVGESLTFRVEASDGRSSTSWDVTPKNWQFDQTFEGKNFK